MKCFLKYSTTYKLWLLIRPSVCVWCISIHCFQFYTFSNEMMLFCVMETCCSPNCQSIQMSVCHCSVFIVAECAPVSTCAVSTHHQGGDIGVEIETIDCGSRPCDCGIHRPIDPPRCVCMCNVCKVQVCGLYVSVVGCYSDISLGIVVWCLCSAQPGQWPLHWTGTCPGDYSQYTADNKKR